MSTSERLLGYCTNVHAGATLDHVRRNLVRYAARVRAELGTPDPLPIGLWLADETSRELVTPDQQSALAHWLGEHRLRAFTLNGFPLTDFHQPVVKHSVYEPDWSTPERYDYTLRLAGILAGLLPEGEAGSISTLPLGWHDGPALRAAAALRFRDLADELRVLEEETGHLVHIDIEPEPGCALGTSRDLVDFFEQDLLPGGDEDLLRRYVRVCHDVCHAAVMFEPQAEVLARYDAAGIAIGKVQISSAPRVDFGLLDAEAADRARRELEALAEPRYLHQTSIRDERGAHFHEDLPAALAAHPPAGTWCVHFHVPVYLERCGTLGTTRDQIGELLAALGSQVTHLEVETYAWGVLPAELAQPDLAAGIARELRWVRGVLDS